MLCGRHSLKDLETTAIKKCVNIFILGLSGGQAWISGRRALADVFRLKSIDQTMFFLALKVLS